MLVSAVCPETSRAPQDLTLQSISSLSDREAGGVGRKEIHGGKFRCLVFSLWQRECVLAGETQREWE